MDRKVIAASVAVAILNAQVGFAQVTLPAPGGGATAQPTPMSPVSDDTPEEIAKDSARDLKDSRFYNRPGATRAEYDADWQACRLIARGSRTPSGSVPMFYNPALISPLAAGVGAGIGGLIAGAIIQGQQRRANRRSCLLIRGWRMIEVPPATATRVAAMTDAARLEYFSGIVGATTVEGKVTERTSFSPAVDPALKLDAPVFGPGTVYLGKKVDPKAPFALAPNEAVIVIAYRRPDLISAGRDGVVRFARYDITGRDLMYRPKDWKKLGDKTVYELSATSADRKSPYEVQVLRVTAGDYVIASTEAGTKLATSSYCFGAPTFHVNPGETAYIGDFVPLVGAKLSTNTKLTTLAYTAQVEDARRTLTNFQPALAAAMKPAGLYNRATFACSAITMDRWDVAGAPALADAPQVATR